MILARARRVTLTALAAIVPVAAAHAQPDVGLCVIHEATRWGELGGITAYSVGSTTVNGGTSPLNWIQIGTDHPVFTQNMFRLLNGRLEQIGQSWVRHAFCALQLPSACGTGCDGRGGCLSVLNPGCQTPNSAATNGNQTLMGPRWQVNAHTGGFVWPFAGQGETGDVIFKRLQVHNADLGDPEALYFVEGMWVAADDAAAGNQDDNASYRMVSIGSAPTFALGFVSGQPTQFQQAAIRAWSAHGLGVGRPDPDVVLVDVRVPDDGLFIVGHRAADNGDGTWHYEYAIQNLNSHRSAAAFAVPTARDVTVINPGFHDVDYHSNDGEGGDRNFDSTDWAVEITTGSVSWRTDTFDANPNANALRWGTLYNFSFDADAPPADTVATIGLFRPGTPDEVHVAVRGPAPASGSCPWDLDGDLAVGIADLLALLAAWGPAANHPADFDGDGIVGVGDLLQLLAHWGPCD